MAQKKTGSVHKNTKEEQGVVNGENQTNWGKIIGGFIAIFLAFLGLFWEIGGGMALGDALLYSLIGTLVLLCIRHFANRIFSKIGYKGTPTNLLLIFLVIFSVGYHIWKSSTLRNVINDKNTEISNLSTTVAELETIATTSTIFAPISTDTPTPTPTPTLTLEEQIKDLIRDHLADLSADSLPADWTDNVSEAYKNNLIHYYGGDNFDRFTTNYVLNRTYTVDEWKNIIYMDINNISVELIMALTHKGEKDTRQGITFYIIYNNEYEKWLINGDSIVSN